MNFLRIGRRSINGDLVALIEESPQGEPDGVSIVLALGGSFLFTGPDAEAIRVFLAENARPITPPEADFAHGAGEGPLLPEAEGREARG